MKYTNEMQKCQYYCPICGHTMTFVLDIKSKICNHCKIRVDRPEKSVYEINEVKWYKRKFEEFLKKKEGM